MMSNRQGETAEAYGVTASERYLTRLCRKAFLHLWSYPNLYRDQGKTGDKGHGKELCDLVVVFGADVLLFSDKHCAWPESGDLEVRWARWYRRAVLKSACQIRGAERWLLSHSNRVFVDRECTQPFPLSLPEQPRLHRIVTCRGAAEACRQHFGGKGSLIVTNETMESCTRAPFHLGALDLDGHFYHVLDEVTLDLVLDTLDTVSDAVDYFRRKEQFFRRHDHVRATGEEDLLAFYLGQLHEDGKNHDFVVDENNTFVGIDESHWSGWLESAQREAKIEADRISYSWDRLIEKFSYHMAAGTQHFTRPGGLKHNEIIVRWMAREPRVRRRMLAESLLDMMASTPVGQLRRRMLVPQSQGQPLWVFLVLPRKEDMAYDQYREFRRAFLEAHCLVAKHLVQAATDILGIAVDRPHARLSEDAVYLDAREWTPESSAKAKTLYEDQGIFRSANRIERTYYEFPVEEALNRGRPDG